MKTIKNFKNILLILLYFTLTVGCANYLEEKPLSFVAPENFYQNANQIKMVFSKSIDLFYGAWNGEYPWVMATTFRHTDQIAGGYLLIPEGTGTSLWYSHYRAIMNLNFAIKALKNNQVKEPENVLNELEGMAKCLRAWNYHNLVQLFGDIPIMTEDTEDYFTSMPGRSPVKEVYDLIVSDYLTAINFLPSNPRQVAHPNKEVAKALLAKAYLCMASYPLNDPTNWVKARDLAWEIIQDDKYSLVENIEEVFSLETETGPEMMWSFISNKNDVGIHPQVWSSMNGWRDIGVDFNWAMRFPEQPRKEAYLELYSLDGEYFLDIGDYPGVKKMLYDADFSAATNYGNMPVIRYADVLLIYAEAANMANNGPTDQAVWAVNLIVDRANGYVENPLYPKATLAMSKEEFDDFVFEERNWELCFELADRWFDLIRKRALEKYIHETELKNFSEDDYLLPLPEKDLRLNPNLTQNPGYPTYR